MSVLAIALFGAGAVAAGFPRRAGSGVERAFRAVIALALGIGAWSAAYAGWLMAKGVAGTGKNLPLAAAGAALWIAFRRRQPATESRAEAAPRWLWLLF